MRGLGAPGTRASLLAIAGLAVAMVLVLLLLPSGRSTPDLDDVAAAAARPATGPAPAAGRERALGWTATGSRTDRLGDRDAVTVRYRRGDEAATVTVVAGGPLGGEAPAGAVVRREAGRTRVIAGAGVPRDDLLGLAAAVAARPGGSG